MKKETILKFKEYKLHGNGDSYLLGASIYASANDTIQKSQKGRIQKLRNPQTRKQRQQPQKIQQSNATIQEIWRSMKKKWNLTRQLIGIQQNSHTMRTINTMMK